MKVSVLRPCGPPPLVWSANGHPPQAGALANEVFTPSEEAVTEAREILAAMEEAQKTGSGAAVYKGRLVDIASVRQAEVIVRQAELIAG